MSKSIGILFSFGHQKVRYLSDGKQNKLLTEKKEEKKGT